MKQKSPRPLRTPAEKPKRRSMSAYRNRGGGRLVRGRRNSTPGLDVSKHAQRNWRRTDPETGKVFGDRVPNRTRYAVQWSTTKRLPWEVRKERRAASKRARASRKANR